MAAADFHPLPDPGAAESALGAVGRLYVKGGPRTLEYLHNLPGLSAAAVGV